MGSTGAHCQGQLLHLGESWEDWANRKLLAGLANIVAEQILMNLLLEKPTTQAMRVWKRERERFISDAGTWGEEQAQALTADLSAYKMDT